MLIDVGTKLVNFKSAELDSFRADFISLDIQKIFANAANRYLKKQIQEVSRLKTDKVVANRIAKITATINNLEHMPPEVKSTIIENLEMIF